MLRRLGSIHDSNHRQNMLVLEGDMPAQAFEEAAQHEANRFGIVDGLAMADRQQNLGHLSGKAFVLDMLGAQSPG